MRACKRSLRPEGRVAFVTIAVSPGLSKSEHRRAARIGPRGVASNKTPEELLTSSGFTDVETVDVTQDFIQTAKSWHHQYSEHEAALRKLLGNALDELFKNRIDLITGVEEGLLQRTLAYGRKAS